MFKNVSEAGNHYNLNICEVEAEVIRNSRSSSATVNYRRSYLKNKPSFCEEGNEMQKIDHLLQNDICFR